MSRFTNTFPQWLRRVFRRRPRHQKGPGLFFLPAVDNDGRLAVKTLQPFYGLLKHGLFTKKRQKLLGVKLPRQGPKACPGAAGEDDWYQRFGLAIF